MILFNKTNKEIFFSSFVKIKLFIFSHMAHCVCVAYNGEPECDYMYFSLGRAGLCVALARLHANHVCLIMRFRIVARVIISLAWKVHTHTSFCPSGK